MSAKTKNSVIKRPMSREQSYNGYNIAFCREIVTNVADNLIGNVLGRYEELQQELLTKVCLNFAGRVYESMMSFEALSQLNFPAASVVMPSLVEIQPAVAQTDTYSRKIVGHRANAVPRSASSLFAKGLSKVKSTITISKLTRGSAIKKPQSQL